MRTIGKVLLTTVAAAAAACSGGNGGRGGSGLAVSTHSSAAPSDTSSAGLTLPNGIEITEIRMAVRKIFVDGDDAEFACSTAGEKRPTAPPASTMMDPGFAGSCQGDPNVWAPDEGFCTDHGHHGPEWGDDDKCDLSFGPFDVDIAGSALTGQVSFAFSAPIPDGTYDEIVIDVDTIPSTLAASNATLLALSEAHASIIVDGFVEENATTTVPFHFSTPMDVRQKREGKIVVGQGSNVTLDFDPTLWFSGQSGRLDPTDPTNRWEILANIRASIRILKDADRDGDDDGDGGDQDGR